MNKRVKIIVVGGILILLTVFMRQVLYEIDRPMYWRLYFGDRIKGFVNILIDGDQYSSKELEYIGCKSKILKDGTTKISLKANSHGEHSFDIILKELEQPITICFFQANWWNICSFDLRISVDTKEQTVTLCTITTDLNNDGEETHVRIEETFSYKDEIRFLANEGIGNPAAQHVNANDTPTH